MFVVLALLTFRTISGQECFDDGNEFCINEDDILSVDLLPGSFLFSDQRQARNASQALTNETMDGSYYKALNAMEYHRKKMNEYLCHGFMAEEIFKVVSTPRVKRRPELPSANNMDEFLGEENVTIHDKLLADEGSVKYKNWLQRTTTLDDIYQHYAPHKKMKKKQGIAHGHVHNIEEFDGEVTGYAMQAPLPSGKVGYYEGPTGHEDHMISSSSGHNFHYGPSYGHGDHFPHHAEFFPAVHEEHYYPASYHHEHEEEYHRPHYPKAKAHELSIRDFFEIALTALAFLAFGLFIIQLLMNATSNMNATTPMVMMDGQRFKRNVGGLPLDYTSNEELNELSYRVLRSIEAALIAEMDSGNCLRRILCEDNQHSKQTRDARKIWVPVWSLGMSWISGRVLRGSPWSAMLDSVKASVLGLGGADCAALYAGCDLQKERIKRRRRRRK